METMHISAGNIFVTTYSGSVTMLSQPAAMGSPEPKKPSSVKATQALQCARCKAVWVSYPYDLADDPPLHRLVCVDGWTPEYSIFTVTYWGGYSMPTNKV